MKCYFCSQNAVIVVDYIWKQINVCNYHLKKVQNGTIGTVGTKNMAWNSTNREAQLIYEEVIKGYKFKFLKGFSKDVIEIIKRGIPSHMRSTSGPPEWEWFIDASYFDLIKLSLDGAGFKIKLITKEDIEALRAKQSEAQQQSQNQYNSYVQGQRNISIQDEIQKFINLLLPVNVGKNGDFEKEVKNWNREEAQKAYRKATRFYHPDINPIGASQMAELNRTWTILKEGYYIK